MLQLNFRLTNHNTAAKILPVGSAMKKTERILKFACTKGQIELIQMSIYWSKKVMTCIYHIIKYS